MFSISHCPCQQQPYHPELRSTVLTLLAIVSVVACLACVGIEESDVSCDKLNKARCLRLRLRFL